MKKKYLLIVSKFILTALLGYCVGWLIYYLSPTGSSQNAPITCIVGSIAFLLFKDYLIPYFRNQTNQE